MDRIFLNFAGVLLCFVSMTVLAQENPRLVEAAREQDWQTLYSLLQEGGVDVNTRQADGATALAWAVHWGEHAAVRSLLDAGADPDLGNDYGVTPLFLAIKNHDRDMLQLLLEVEGGSDPNAALWSGETPLMTAARGGDAELVSLLLEHGAEVNSLEPRRGQSALMWAISFGRPEAARVLIEHGADVNARTRMLDEDFTPMELEGYLVNVRVTPQGGYTPLMFAARVGDLETARLLLERGAEVNSMHAEHGPPLVIAAAAGHEELALFLLEWGADPQLTDVNGMTALHYAMRDGLKPLHNIKIVRATAGQDKGSLLPGGNLYELAEALLRRGADPNAAMKYPPPVLRVRPSRISRFQMVGATPFLLAAAAQDLKAMKLLLEAGADPLRGTQVDRDTFIQEVKVHSSENQILGTSTPLMAAVGMGRRNGQSFSASQEEQALQAAELLIGLGADVNEATASGWTPLHAAAFIGADRLVAYLVKQGAQINVRNGCGQTPLSLAMRASVKGLIEIELPSDIRQSTAELLSSLGADENAATAPVGECILGRAGLELELIQQQQIRIK